jgi:hypothetical protein
MQYQVPVNDILSFSPLKQLNDPLPFVNNVCLGDGNKSYSCFISRTINSVIKVLITGIKAFCYLLDIGISTQV